MKCLVALLVALMTTAAVPAVSWAKTPSASARVTSPPARGRAATPEEIRDYARREAAAPRDLEKFEGGEYYHYRYVPVGAVVLLAVLLVLLLY